MQHKMLTMHSWLIWIQKILGLRTRLAQKNNSSQYVSAAKHGTAGFLLFRKLMFLETDRKKSSLTKLERVLLKFQSLFQFCKENINSNSNSAYSSYINMQAIRGFYTSNYIIWLSVKE
jgi:hypothetical protein